MQGNVEAGAGFRKGWVQIRGAGNETNPIPFSYQGETQ